MEKNPWNQQPLLDVRIELPRKLSSDTEQDKIFLNGIDRSPVDLKPQKKVKLIDNYYDRVGYSKYQYIQIVIASLVNIVIGVESLIPNLIVVQIQKEMGVELYKAAMLVAGFGLGAAFGKIILFHLTILQDGGSGNFNFF